MSFRDCINNALGEGTITPEQADEARTLFDELEAEYQGRMNGAAATSQAARDTFDALQTLVRDRKRRKLLQVQKWREITMNLESYRGIDGKPNKGRAALALLEQDGLSRYSSVVQREQAIEASATRLLYNVLSTFRRNILGQTRKKAKLENMVREAFGENTGDASAKEMAEAWKTAHDYLRKRFNAAGGSIAKLANWGLPQIHDMIKVRKVTFQEWRDFIIPELSIEKMIDEQTGLPFSPERLELALRDVYETIRTDGFSKIIPGARYQGKSVASRRTDHRFLVFKDASSWIKYQKRFGNDNAFDVMFGHIKSMARDTAQLEILGPNPTGTLQFIKQTIQKEAAGDLKAENAARKYVYKLDELYGAVTSRNNAPVDGVLANTLAGTRELLVASQLGGASLLATTDLNFQRIAREFAGLPQTKMLQDYLNLLLPLAGEEKRKLAVRLGLIAEAWTTLASAQQRYVGDVAGPEVTRRIADFVLRASLLSPWTQAGRWSFGMEFLGTLADNVGKTYDELDAPLRNTMERYGIRADHWDIMRSTELYDHNGATFLRAEDIEARTDINPTVARDLGTRLLEMVRSETEFAVPNASVRGRVALTGETRPGTISGELMRSFAMYKNFGVTLINTHAVRGLSQSGASNKGKYLAGFIVSTTIMGALAMQLKEIAKGRDPRPMTDAEFWGAALLTGGGFGVFGDFLFSNVNRHDRGLAETVAGPVVGLANDIKNLTIGNVIEAAKGEDTNIASEAIRFAGRYTPGSTLWYTRLGLERLVIDQLQMMADPKARSKLRRLEGRYRTDYGQKYWWRPGETEPRRAPDMGNILKDRQ